MTISAELREQPDASRVRPHRRSVAALRACRPA
nr:MAG TPA: hypothetical protein [Caudoviricetes sp.]